MCSQKLNIVPPPIMMAPSGPVTQDRGRCQKRQISSPREEGQLALGHEAEGGNDEDCQAGDPKSPTCVHVRKTVQAETFQGAGFHVGDISAIKLVLVSRAIGSITCLDQIHGPDFNTAESAAQYSPKSFVLVSKYKFLP